MIDVTKVIKAKFTPICQDKEPEKWSELRMTGIGGSDAGAICGYNEYASPLSVYLAKKGLGVKVENNAVKWGHILEDPIRKEVAKEIGVEIVTVPGMYTSNEFPWMNANIDGLVHAENQVSVGGREVEGFGIHEIKTSANGDGFSEDEIPDSYYCQVQHYMAVTGLDWTILSVFILSRRELKSYVINKNNLFIDTILIPKEKEFWENYVEKDITPAPTGASNETDSIKQLPMAEMVELDDSILETLEKEREIDKQIKTLKEQQDALKNEILLAIYKASENASKSEKTTATVGDFKITYNLQIKKSVDSDALKKAGIYENYLKESASKVMRISGGK